MKTSEFFKKIANEMTIKNQVFDADDFYYILKYIGIKKDNSLVADIEKFYQDFLESLNNSLVKFTTKTKKSGENATHYIGFYVDKSANYQEAVKVYFPVKYEYLISSLKTIFLYLIRNNIKAIIKFHLKATNESIVIRFYEKKDVMPFINYCKSSFVLKDLLEKPNPFIATIYGIGLVCDDNKISSYNAMVSELLCEYFKHLKETNNLQLASDLHFLDFIITKKENTTNETLKFDIEAVEKNLYAILNHNNPWREKDLL